MGGINLKIKDAKKVLVRKGLVCSIIAILIFWLLKILGIMTFPLDTNVAIINDLHNFFIQNYWLLQIYYVITLNIQLYFMTCIVQKDEGISIWSYLLKILPLTIGVRVLTSIFSSQLGNLTVLIEFLFLVLATSKFDYKKFIKGLICILFLTLYQMISLITRNIGLGTNTYGFIVDQILSIDLYLLLYLHKEVILMDSGTWLFFGLTAWLYAVAGFIVGIFKGHPIINAKKWYAKGKAKEDARSSKKKTKRTA